MFHIQNCSYQFLLLFKWPHMRITIHIMLEIYVKGIQRRSESRDGNWERPEEKKGRLSITMASFRRSCKKKRKRLFGCPSRKCLKTWPHSLFKLCKASPPLRGKMLVINHKFSSVLEEEEKFLKLISNKKLWGFAFFTRLKRNFVYFRKPVKFFNLKFFILL